MSDIVGFLASGMVLATFSMRSMLWLRVLALGSNVAFICYGLMLALWPILLLHLLLLPLNAMRLNQIIRDGRRKPRRAAMLEVFSAR